MKIPRTIPRSVRFLVDYILAHGGNAGNRCVKWETDHTQKCLSENFHISEQSLWNGFNWLKKNRLLTVQRKNRLVRYVLDWSKKPNAFVDLLMGPRFDRGGRDINEITDLKIRPKKIKYPDVAAGCTPIATPKTNNKTEPDSPLKRVEAFILDSIHQNGHPTRDKCGRFIEYGKSVDLAKTIGVSPEEFYLAIEEMKTKGLSINISMLGNRIYIISNDYPRTESDLPPAPELPLQYPPRKPAPVLRSKDDIMHEMMEQIRDITECRSYETPVQAVEAMSITLEKTRNQMARAKILLHKYLTLEADKEQCEGDDYELQCSILHFLEHGE